MGNAVGRVISLKKKHKIDIDKIKYPAVLTLSGSLGIFCGVLLLGSIDITGLGDLIRTFVEFNTVNDGKSFLEILSSALISNLIYTAAVMLSGLCLAGSPFIYAAPYVKGLGIGLISAYMYSEYAINGLEYCVLMIYPSAVIMFISIILGSTEGLYTHHEIQTLVYKTEDIICEFSIKQYIKRNIVPILLSIAASVIGALSIMMFSDLFVF